MSCFICRGIFTEVRSIDRSIQRQIDQENTLRHLQLNDARKAKGVWSVLLLKSWFGDPQQLVILTDGFDPVRLHVS